MKSVDKNKDYIADHYFLNTAKANLLDILLVTGWIKKSHIEYGLKELDQIDRDLLNKEWSDEDGKTT
ncbi:hypothetical protein [Streptococcus uberis]